LAVADVFDAGCGASALSEDSPSRSVMITLSPSLITRTCSKRVHAEYGNGYRYDTALRAIAARRNLAAAVGLITV
jgi:hypothetical protein